MVSSFMGCWGVGFGFVWLCLLFVSVEGGEGFGVMEKYRGCVISYLERTEVFVATVCGVVVSSSSLVGLKVLIDEELSKHRGHSFSFEWV